VLLFFPGCLSRQLELTTRRTLSTLPDLNYQQVIDNLAAAASNPGVLPYLAVAGQGSGSGHRQRQLDLRSELPATGPGIRRPGAGRLAERHRHLEPRHDHQSDKIRAMQALTRVPSPARSTEILPTDGCTSAASTMLPRALFYAGRHGEVSVWVMPEEIAGLSELTLAILDVATRQDDSPAADASKASPHRVIVPRRNFQVPASGPVFTAGRRLTPGRTFR